LSPAHSKEGGAVSIKGKIGEEGGRRKNRNLALHERKRKKGLHLANPSSLEREEEKKKT